MITTLIDKEDSIEIVRDQIAAILVAEFANQRVLAAAAGKDPELWRVHVYTERSLPFERWLADPEDRTPILNVVLARSDIDLKRSDVVKRQAYAAQFTLEVYGHGRARSDGGVGHLAADEDAARNRDRCVRLVRNILAASTNIKLQLQPAKIVWGSPIVAGVEYFRPTAKQENDLRISAAHIAVELTINETSPQYQADVLEYVGVDIHRALDGAIIAEVDIDYTAP